MPTYEFRCNACGTQFEVFQSMSAPDPSACEACGAQGQLEKVLFPVAVHYKGSGFYSTDYSGKKAPSSSESAASGAGSSDAGSTSSGGDSGASGSSDASSASTGTSSGSAD